MRTFLRSFIKCSQFKCCFHLISRLPDLRRKWALRKHGRLPKKPPVLPRTFLAKNRNNYDKTGHSGNRRSKRSLHELLGHKDRKTVYLADPLMTDMTEEDEALAAEMENTPERFLRFPTKYEIHQYRMMEAFIDRLSSGKVQEELAYAIRGKGAFRRFKQSVR